MKKGTNALDESYMCKIEIFLNRTILFYIYPLVYQNSSNIIKLLISLKLIN